MSNKFAGALLAVEKPSRMLLLHPKTKAPYADKDGNFAFIDVHSSDSPVFRNHIRERAARRLDERTRREPTLSGLETEAIENSVVLTADWYLLSLVSEEEIDAAGEKRQVHAPLDVPFSPENARELYGLPGGAFYRDQVDHHAGGRENFLKASSKTS